MNQSPTGDKVLADSSWENFEKFFGQRDHLAWLYEGFDLYGNHGLAIAAPRGLPKSCGLKLSGAVFAYTLGISSVDYTIKNYLGKAHRQKKHTLTDPWSNKQLELSKSGVSQVLKAQSELRDLPDRFGLVAAGAALIRLESSFASSSLLIRLGHNFEAATVMKLILEQLGWALRVHEIADDSLFKIPPSECISNLKKLLPMAGSFYGVLNEEAHLKPELIKRFIELSKSETSASVRVRDRSYSILTSFMHLCLADVFCVVLESVYREHLSRLRHIRVASNEQFAPRINRPIAVQIRRAKAKLVAANKGTPWVNYLARIFA